MPNISTQEWRSFFSERYDCRFSDRAIDLFKRAIDARVGNEDAVLDSFGLIPFLVGEGNPLHGLRLPNIVGAGSPNSELTETAEPIEEGQSLPIPFTRELREILLLAVEMAKAERPQSAANPKCSEWHIAGALLEVSPPGLRRWTKTKGTSWTETDAKFVFLRNVTPSATATRNWHEFFFATQRNPQDQELVLISPEEYMTLKIQEWTHQFKDLRNGDIPWSTGCDAVFGALFKQFESSFQATLNDPVRRGLFCPQLIPRSVFLACLLFGESTEPQGSGDSSKSDSRADLLSSLSRASSIDALSELSSLLTTPRQQGNTSVFGPICQRVFNRANLIRTQAGNDPYVATRHLLLALLEPPKDGVTCSLVLYETELPEVSRQIVEAFGEIISKITWARKYEAEYDWPNQIDRLRYHLAEPAPEGPDLGLAGFRGGLSSYHRNSSEQQLAANTEDYARAIASAFRNAGDDDFCFAVFGPWGRGKTTLMNKVSKLLCPKKTPGAKDPENCDYTPITFNAWKYPNRPEVWIHLYETIKEVACAGKWHRRFRFAVQTSVRKDRGFPLLIPALILLCASLPKFAVIQWIFPTLSLISIGIMLAYFGAFRRSVLPAFRSYLDLPNHAEKLGLQGTIGDDLTRLLSVWIWRPCSRWSGSGRNRPNQQAEPSKWQNSKSFFWEQIAISTPFLISVCLVITSLGVVMHRVWGKVNPSLYGLLIAVIIGLITLAVFSLWHIHGPKRALLTVDDLDRCDHRDMLAVIESIRVFLDNQEISNRLQVAMLLDKDILSFAIHQKYDDLLKAETPATPSSVHPEYPKEASRRLSADNVVREQLEKYFLLHFNLPPLASKELWDVGNAILGVKTNGSTPPVRPIEEEDLKPREEDKAPSPELVSGADPVSPSVIESDSKSQSIPKASEEAPSISLPQPSASILRDEVDDSCELHQDETKKFMEILFAEHGSLAGQLTPRRIHSLKMRYMLAREILDALGITYEAVNLIKALSPNDLDHPNDPELMRVVSLVS